MSADVVSTFADAVWAAWDDPKFMAEYRRLTGAKLGADERAAIERLIDEATGREPPAELDVAEVVAFLDFVRDYVWRPLVRRLETAT